MVGDLKIIRKLHPIEQIREQEEITITTAMSEVQDLKEQVAITTQTPEIIMVTVFHQEITTPRHDQTTQIHQEIILRHQEIMIPRHDQTTQIHQEIILNHHEVILNQADQVAEVLAAVVVAAVVVHQVAAAEDVNKNVKM